MTKEEILQQLKEKFEKEAEEYLDKVSKMMDDEKLTIHSLDNVTSESIENMQDNYRGTSELILEANIESRNIPKCSNCDQNMKRVKKKQKLGVIFSYGKVEIERDYYFCRRCGKGAGIGDDYFEIHDEYGRMTSKVIELMTYMAQLVPSFERASTSLNKLKNIKISTVQIQKVSELVGKKVFHQEYELANKIYVEPEKYLENRLDKDRKKGRLYIMADGSAVNTRVKSEGSTWKEMKLGLVFCDQNMLTRKDGMKMITEKEYVSFFGTVENFKKMLLSAAINQGYGSIQEVVVIGDGAKWIWKMCDEVFPDAIRILDYYHMSENVYGYANHLFGEDIKKRDRWVKRILKKIKCGNAKKVIIELSKQDYESLPKGTPNLKTYLENNLDKIDYKDLKNQGYFIGSGAIESGNKMVIHQRLKQSGMRWSVDGAQYISSLRTKHESNQWDKVVDIIVA